MAFVAVDEGVADHRAAEAIRADLGVDVDQMLEGGARYRDKRPVAKKMWETMMSALQEIGALPKGPLP